MHRHGNAITKLGRQRDQRRALMRSLAVALIEQESIETTLPKAKALVPFVERMITKAKDGSLHKRRQVISTLGSAEMTHRLFDEIAPKLGGRTSGHLRLERTRLRRGDNTQMARVSFVDNLEAAPAPKPAAKKAPTKPAAKKTATKKSTQTKAGKEKA